LLVKTPTASFEAFPAVMFLVSVLCFVTPYSVVVGYQRFGGPCCLPPEDGGSMVIWDVGILPRHYTAS